MRAKLDENLPVEAAELLRTAGWECDSVYDEGLAGADDPEVAAACQAGVRVITLDFDFAVGCGLWSPHAFACVARTNPRFDNAQD